MAKCEYPTSGRLEGSLSALWQKFVTNARDVTVFSDPTVLMARRASEAADGRQSQIQRELKRFQLYVAGIGIHHGCEV